MNDANDVGFFNKLPKSNPGLAVILVQAVTKAGERRAPIRRFR
jgi:hypothetical protein